MTTRFLRKFFRTAFIGIVIDDDKCDVGIKIYKGSKQLSSDSRLFQLQNTSFPTTLISYIENTYKTIPYVYSSVLLTSINQGGIPECSKDSFAKFHVESRHIQSLCIDGKWNIYTGKSDIDNSEATYEKLGGVDFIFSPLLVLRRFFAKELTKDSVIMTVLKLKSLVCTAVFNGDKLLYSSFMAIKNLDSAKNQGKTEEGAGFEDLFDEEGVHELGEDNMVDLDDLSVELEEEAMQPLSDSIEDEAMKNQKSSIPVSLEDAGNNLKLADFIKESFNEFYKNPLYDAAFIDKLYIADPYVESTDTKLILENELMLSVELRQIDIGFILCDFAEEEAR